MDKPSFLAKTSLIEYSNTILLIIAVAIAYFLFGLLGLQISIPPSQASAIWPPSGLALAAMLRYGTRIWPGIFIGNFLVTSWAFGFSPQSIQIYFATGMGATFFTFTGSYLINKYSSSTIELINDKEIILFVLLGGPVSCLIPATIGISAMSVSGIISAPEIPINWFAWWISDTLGVLIFTPILLTVLSSGSKLWKSRRLSLGIPLITCFATILLFFFYIINLEDQRHQQLFNDNSIKLNRDLASRINNHLRFIHSLQNLYRSSEHVTEHDFELFTQSFFNDFNENKDFKFLKYSANNTTPWTLIHHKLKEGHINSDLIITSELLDSIKNNRYKIKNIAFLSQHTKNIGHFYTAVYSTDNTVLRGVFVSTISLPQLIKNTYAQSNTSESIRLSIHNAQNNSLIYGTETPQASTLEHTLYIANQQWKLTFYPADNTTFKHIGNQHYHAYTHWSIWWLLISGFIFTGLLGFGLLLLTGRYQKTEQLISARTRELLTAKNTAESANLATSQFLSHISHELRTPLNGILGFSQLLQKKPYISPEDKKQIGIISHCGNHLLTMINDILEISKFETNKIIINPATFNFKHFIDNIISIFTLRAEQKNLKFIVNQAMNIEWVKGDDNRIQQVINNLLDNAIKFTDEGSITLNISHEKGFLKISVIDTGCGISTANQQVIFTPFTQVGHHNFSEHGLGLGLSICYNLTQLMAGSISVSSVSNQGSTFDFSIPLATASFDNTQRNTTDLSKPPLENMHILIAEDNNINLMLITVMVQSLNCTFDTAINGYEAMKLLTTKNYQLALIDINMPLINGFELIQSIRKQNMTLPVIAISAYSDKTNIGKALSLGFDNYLTKPIDQQKLKEMIYNYE